VKNRVYIFIVVILGIVLLFVTKDRDLINSLSVIIEQKDRPLTFLDKKAKTIKTKKIFLNRLEFQNSNHLINENYGDLGFSRDFVMEIRARMDIKKSGKYLFHIYSDDGFRLKINNETVCQFIKSRPIDKTICEVFLRKGVNNLYIKYFQGYGNLGLRGFYKYSGDIRFYYIGESSSNIKFKELK